MIDVKPKSVFSILIAITVLAGIGVGFVSSPGVTAVDASDSLVAQDSIDTQAEENPVKVCGDDLDEGQEGLNNLLTNLLSFVVAAATIGAFALTVLYKAQESFDVDGSNLGNNSDWTKPISGLIMLYVVLYGGAIAIDMIFGINVTCTLPGIGG